MKHWMDGRLAGCAATAPAGAATSGRTLRCPSTSLLLDDLEWTVPTNWGALAQQGVLTAGKPSRRARCGVAETRPSIASQTTVSGELIRAFLA